METIKLDLETLTVAKMQKLVKEGYSIHHLLQQYKDDVFEKNKQECLATKWACLAGRLEGILTIILINSLEDDTRI
jgi:hypothetical protein